MGQAEAVRIAASVVEADLLTVRLHGGGWPRYIRLALPSRMTSYGSSLRLAVVAARADALVKALACDWDPAFPNIRKLRTVLDAVQLGRPLTLPMLRISAVNAAAGVHFETGRHRVLMLHELGATRIPVLTPWHEGTEVLKRLNYSAPGDAKGPQRSQAVLGASSRA